MNRDKTLIPAPPATMRAATRRRYGDSGVLELTEVATPTVGPRSVLVEVVATALNPFDWHSMTGTPWLVRLQGGLRRPKDAFIGVDLAGRVVAVGAEVTEFEPGDEVAGMVKAAFAEYVVCSPNQLVPKPGAVSFDEATGVGIAATTALQGLRDQADLQAGQKVLINGAAGGVGTAAVQLAKWMGAEVTAVCSTRNVELMQSLGADNVIDYTRNDFTDSSERYDVVFDNQGNRSLRRTRRILTDGGVYVLAGGPKKNRVFGPMVRMVRAIVGFRFTNKRARPFIADQRQDDLVILAGLLASGDLRTIVGGTYALDELTAAMDELAGGHVRGKLIVKP